VAFKPNYNQQRAERNRAKQAKAEAKAREREEQVARRKAGLPDLEPTHQDSGEQDSGDTTTDEPVPGETPAST
jgi:hypothetical protein